MVEFDDDTINPLGDVSDVVKQSVSEWDQFDELARKLVAVPKSEVDEKRDRQKG